jgi:hypothetical protein
MAEIREVKKIQEKLLRFIIHRGKALLYGGVLNQKRFQTIAELTNKFQSLQYKRMDQIARAILNSEAKLIQISPSTYSRSLYNRGLHAEILTIINEAKAYAKRNNI